MPKPLWRTEKSWADYFDIQNDIFHINHATRIFVHGSFSFTGNTNMMLAVLWAGGQIVTSNKEMAIIDSFLSMHSYLYVAYKTAFTITME